MKKYVVCLILAFTLSQAAFSQNVDELLKKFSATEKTESVKIGRFMMTLGKMFGGASDMPVAKGIHSMEVMTLSNNSKEVNEKILQQFNNVKDGSGY